MPLRIKVAGIQKVPTNIREWDQFFRGKILVIADDDSVETIQLTDNSVTLAKLADMATDSFIGRDTDDVGDPEILSALAAQIVLQTSSRVTVTTTSHSAGDERIILVDDDTAGGDVTIALDPAADRENHIYYIKKLGSTGNVFANPDGAELIDGSVLQILASRYNSITIISDGSAWWIL